ncbi:glucose-1-phosphate cytidylyltransferase [Paenibacillus sp. YIM B09110]|uniref:glucose-1-phosphate cytidylyltransferase n=1 Tax=Paenibacillus sp. YIM B09110 TaxID=3126102 RepID=UPI00301C9613
MKVVILAGGYGTRISEESVLTPKPMIEIGGKPILWHILKIYSSYGFNDFIICLGYKGDKIKQYFYHYALHNSDVTFDYSQEGQMTTHQYIAEPWRVTLVDTGKDTMTGGRIKRVKDYLGDEPFMLTYGDGVSDINIRELVEFHIQHGKMATLTAVQPPGRFGSLKIDADRKVEGFAEKTKGDGGWINAGFFVMKPEMIDYIEGDHSILEHETLEKLAMEGKLMAYPHTSFWHPMDTLRDKNYLDELYKAGKAPWKIW